MSPYFEPWRELLRVSPGSTICQHPEWLRSWHEAFAPQEKLNVLLALGEDGGLVGVLPLIEQKRSGFAVWRFLGDGTTDSDGLDVICHPDSRSEVIAAFCNELLSGCWQLLELNTLPAESPNLKLIAGQLSERSLWREKRSAHLVIDLPASSDGYRQMLSTKMRKTVGQARRRMDAEGYSLVRVNETDLAKSLETLFDLHSRSWAARGQEGAFVEESRRNFYRLLSARLLALGALNFWILESEGVPVAAHFGAGFRGTHTYMQAGFHPARSNASVGVALQSMVIDALIAEGYKHFDFMAGDDTYKSRWAAHRTQYVDLRFARTLPAKARFIVAPALVENLRRIAPRPLKAALRNLRGV